MSMLKVVRANSAQNVSIIGQQCNETIDILLNETNKSRMSCLHGQK